VNQLSDLQGQVGLFLLQTDSVPGDGEVRDGIVEYLRRTFLWRGVENADADVYVVYDHLLKHKWWLDDRRAWRQLVRRCIDGLIRRQRPRAALDPDCAPDEHGRLTVDQFAFLTEMSRSKVYELIRNGKLPITRRNDDRRNMISQDVASKFRVAPRRSGIIDVLVERGRSKAAARKWVYRQEQQGQTLTEIAARLVDSDDRRLLLRSRRR
jgi:hypothetical protein